VSALAHDLRYAVRRLRRSPGFAVTAILTLGLGLGAATLLFAAVHTVLLRPLPFTDQYELVLLWERDPANGSPHNEVSLPHFEQWRAQASSFSSLAALGSTEWGDLEVRADAPFALTQRVVSSSFFETLGVSAALGRTFRPSDEVTGAPSVMVLSHASWRRHFGADPAVVGHTLSVVGRDEPLEIVGVMPAAFQFPAGTDAWLPLAPALTQVFRQNGMDEMQRRGLGVLYVIGRLAPAVTREAARAEMDVVVPEVPPSSLTALGGLTAAVLFVCAASTLLAARRAVRIEPSLALRSE
jgi:putative ABC transport system permease protein